MNELLQKHGCSNVFSIPEGLKELMADISREVLRDQPHKIYDYIANYLSVLLITREHGILSVRILDDLCDCRPSVSEHLMQLGMATGESKILADIIKQEIEGFEPEEGKEKVKETHILKKILGIQPLDEDMTAAVCQVIRNAYRDYWYRKRLMEKNLKVGVEPHEAWEVAAERTLELYKRTKPSYSELNRATQVIQAAYRGYYVRRNLLRHMKPKKASSKHPKVDLPGPPLDIAGSREIDLGPVINVRVREEDATVEFDKHVGKMLNLSYDPMKTITHVDGEEEPPVSSAKTSTAEAAPGKSSYFRKSSFKAVEQPDPSEQFPYKLPHMDEMEVRKSIAPEPRTSQIALDEHGAEAEPTLNKISFAEHVEEKEIPEEIPVAEPAAEEALEVPEDIPENPTESVGADSAPEADDSAPEADDSAPEADDSAPEADDSAPEADDSAPEADDSVPEASVPSSAPATEDEAE